MQKMRSVLLAVAGIMLAVFSLTAGADWQLNMKPGVTPVSKEIFELHTWTLYVVYVIAAVVMGVMLWSIIFHRKSRGVKPATWNEHLGFEIAWTVVPFIILIGLAIPATKTLIKLEDTSTDVDITIKATGYQWMWSYEYINDGVSGDDSGDNIFFYSKLDARSNEIRQVRSGLDPAEFEHYTKDVDKRMVIPVGKKVQILTTAADVIHSWWVPDFGGKKDAIPGFVNSLWVRADETGVFRGHCAELCGKDHAYMPVVVEVMEEDDYRAWVAQQKLGGLAEASSETNSIALAAE